MSSLKVTGLESAVTTLRTLAPKMQRAVLRPAARAGTKAPRQELKRQAPRRSGALRKAISSKVTTSKDKTSVTGTVGANRKYAVAVRTDGGKFVSGAKRVAKKAKSADDIMGIRPSRYAHLAGKGRTADYMHEAQQDTQAQTLTDFTARAKTEMLKLAAREAAKNKK